MKTITKPGDNLGGLLKIWAVPTSVYSISGKAVTFSSTDDIYEIYCTPESMLFSEQSEQTGAGTLFNTLVSGFIPKDSEEVLAAKNDMARKPYIVIFIDGNGNYKAAGTANEPLRLADNLSSGQQVSDSAGNQIEFSGKTLTRAVFINNPF
jgi:hypothetical protein